MASTPTAHDYAVAETVPVQAGGSVENGTAGPFQEGSTCGGPVAAAAALIWG
jgi:hypothetical protein